VNLAQTQGIKALLNQQFDEAVQAYGDAYALWPEFRNVDEIQKLLNSLRQPENEQEWKNLYKQITRYDLRGIDAAAIERLREVAR